jgi:hypothetical protein
VVIIIVTRGSLPSNQPTTKTLPFSDVHDAHQLLHIRHKGSFQHAVPVTNDATNEIPKQVISNENMQLAQNGKLKAGEREEQKRKKKNWIENN